MNRRKFFSGNTIRQAVVSAASHFDIPPGEVAYKEVDKRHGFLKVRRKVVIEVDADNPRRAPGAGAAGEAGAAAAGEATAGRDRAAAGGGRVRRGAAAEDERPLDDEVDEEEAARQELDEEDAEERRWEEDRDEEPAEEDDEDLGDEGYEDYDEESDDGDEGDEDEDSFDDAEDDEDDEDDDDDDDEEDDEDLDEDEEDDEDGQRRWLRSDGTPRAPAERAPAGAARAGDGRGRGRGGRGARGRGRETSAETAQPEKRSSARGSDAPAGGRGPGREAERAEPAPRTEGPHRGRRRRGRGRGGREESLVELPERPRRPAERYTEATGEMADACRSALDRILHLAGLDVSYTVLQGEDRLEVDITGTDEALLTAEGGELLRAIEHLLPRAIRGVAGRSTNVRVDSADFHEIHEEQLRSLAQKTAGEVRRSSRPRTLEPMSPADRRIVHLTLADEPGVTSASEGSGYFKRVTVKPD